MNRLSSTLIVALIGALLVFAPASVSAQQTPVLNEAVSVNTDGLTDAYGASSDWIELHNPTGAAVDLSGWGLTDDPGEPLQWSFPAGTLLPADGYLIVFASGDDSIDDELHARFSLSGDGEWIGLVRPDGSVVSTLNLPSLLPDHSFGIASGGDVAVFVTPTPGAPNGAGAAGILIDPTVSPERSFLTAPTQVTITHPDAAATIRYRLDGTAPTSTTGTVYTGPITVDASTALRVGVFRDGWVSDRAVTHTYVFADQVPFEPRMYGPWVDTNAERSAVTEGVLALPAISLVTPGGINQSTRVATSVEWIDPAGGDGFQVDAGIKEVGGTSVKYAKDTWRLAFDGEWGESRLEFPVFDGFPSDSTAGGPANDFKRLTLRMGAHDSTFYDAQNRGYQHYQTYVKGRWGDETMLELGHANTHGRWVNVFLNGEYWGQYHLREHLDDHFMAEYFGGDNDDYLGINRGAVSAGEGDGWAALGAAVGSWSSFREHVDPVAYVDWMLLNEFQGNFWDLRATQNWRGAGQATPAAAPGFTWQGSDQDVTLNSATRAMIFPGPLSSWTALLNERDPEFLVLLNDRVEALLRGNGELTAAAAVERWDRLTAQIGQSLNGELARWAGNMFAGDTTRPLTYTQWVADTTAVRDTVIPARTSWVLTRLASYLTSVQAPAISGGPVPSGTLVPLVNPNGAGDVYVTFDGSDPRAAGGGVAAGAQSLTEVLVTGPVSVTARVRVGNDWSPLVGAEFTAVVDPDAPTIDTPPDLMTVAEFATRFQVDVADPNGDAVTLTTTNLPPGIGLDPATKIIQGSTSAAGVYTVVLTATDGEHSVESTFVWTVLGHAGGSGVPVVLNEYNAVKSSSLLADDGEDAAFGRVAGNGGDWLELFIADDHVDLRGWSLELWDREDGPLVLTDTIEFSNNAVLSDLRAGTLITIAESQAENLTYDPEAQDWDINIRSATGFGSEAVAPEAGNFDSNRHGFRVRLFDAAGVSRSPFMGETDGFKSFANVGGEEIFARCDSPRVEVDPGAADARDSSRSSFGQLNDCGDVVQVRSGLTGDPNCDGEITLADAVLIARLANGVVAAVAGCENASADQVDPYSADVNGDGLVTSADAQLVTMQLVSNG